MAAFAGASGAVDAARALAATPLFAGLSAVELARLVPELEEIQCNAGDTVFRQGDTGDGLYLIRDGSVGVSVGVGDAQRIVAVLEAPAYFGEMALLSDAPRSATILALRPLHLWRLSLDRFDRLIEQQPLILRHAAAEVTRRLGDTTRRLSSSQESLASVAGIAIDALGQPARRIIQAIAVAGEADAARLAAILGPDWSAETLTWLTRESGFFQATAPGSFRLVHDGLKPLVISRLEAELGSTGRRAMERRALEVLLRDGTADPRELMKLALATGEWTCVRDVASRHGKALVETAPDLLEASLEALPNHELWRSPSLPPLLVMVCRLQGKHGVAAEVEREARRRGMALSTSVAEVETSDDETSPRHSIIRRLHQIGSRALGRAAFGQFSQGFLASTPTRRMLAVALTCGFVLAALGSPPADLSPAGYRVLLAVGLTLLLGLLDVLPDYLLAATVVSAWAASGTVPIGIGASGLASSAWFLLLGAFGAGVAVTRSGILFRLAVELTRRLPPNHGVRCVALAFLGLLFTAGMPSTSGRLALASPLAQDIADALRMPHRGPGAAGLALSVFVGFGQMGTLFLTGSSATLVAYGLLPTDVRDQFSWGTWILAALPAHVVLLTLTMIFILVSFRLPLQKEATGDTLRLQRDILGAPRRDEIAVVAVISSLLLGFVTEPWHGIDPGWQSLAALVVLVMVGVVDDASLRTGINWSLLLYLGVVLGFGNVFASVGLDTWLTGRLDGITDLVGESQSIFLLAVALASMVVGLVMRAGPSSAVLCLVLFPLGTSLGINPWVVALAVLMATNLWLHPQQSVYYLVAYYGTGERGFTHEQARPLAFAYAAFVVVAILTSIPYWRWLGLLT